MISLASLSSAVCAPRGAMTRNTFRTSGCSHSSFSRNTFARNPVEPVSTTVRSLRNVRTDDASRACAFASAAMDARHVDALPTRLPEHLSVPIRLVRPRPGRRTRDTTACVAHPSAHDAIADHPDTREARVSASVEPSLPKARAPNTDKPAFLVFDTNIP